MPSLVLIDGHALAYRAYFALLKRGFSTRDGRPTGAVFGFTRMLLEVIRNQKPACVAVSFDRASPTFRHAAYAEYKAHRKRMDDDLVAQMGPIRDVVTALEIPIYEIDGYEADDVIGTMAKQAEAAGFEVLIVTGDRDAFQLVTPHVRVLMPRAGMGDLESFGPEEVRLKMGVAPGQIPDLKGLMGDSSDNIPGVPGIGEKTAVKLLQEFETMENLYSLLNQVAGKTQDKLREHAALARKSLELATIDRAVPLTFDFEACKLAMPNLPRLTQVLEHWELNAIIKQLPQSLAAFDGGKEPAKPQAPRLSSAPPMGQVPLELGVMDAVVADGRPLTLNLTIVDTPETLKALKSALTEAPSFAYDCETDSLQSVRCNLVGLAIAVGGPEVAACRCFYVPIGHEGASQLPWESVKEAVAFAFADPAKEKIAHHAKFDLNVLCRYGLDCGSVTFDTMIADYLVYSGRQSHALKELAREHLGYTMTEIKALIGAGAKAITMARVSVEKAAPYAAADVAVTTELKHFLAPKLLESGQAHIFHDIELPLVPILVGMEQHGITLDLPYLARLSVQLGDRLKQLETEIHALAGESFNINSPKQLGVVLFEKLQLPVLRRTKTGPSTDAAVLDELSDSHSIIKELLEYRQLGKLKSTYVDALPLLVNPKTHRIHTSFNQTVAETGRLSSSDPNLQNIPIRTELGREIRRAFIPSKPGWLIVSADYSQIELRVLAHVTQDPSFLKAFREDQDIHAVTASEIFSVPLESVTSEMRRRAKTTNFGVVYGQSGFGLSKALGIPQKEARDFISRFNARYPGIQHFMIETLTTARQRGYVETLSGRRRYIPELNSPNRALRDVGDRMAINAPIQGTAADIIKLAMGKLAPKMARLEASLLIQVHDELVFEASPNALADLIALTREEMESAFPLDVPLRVDIHSGPNWMEAKGP